MMSLIAFLFRNAHQYCWRLNQGLLGRQTFMVNKNKFQQSSKTALAVHGKRQGGSVASGGRSTKTSPTTTSNTGPSTPQSKSSWTQPFTNAIRSSSLLGKTWLGSAKTKPSLNKYKSQPLTSVVTTPATKINTTRHQQNPKKLSTTSLQHHIFEAKSLPPPGATSATNPPSVSSEPPSIALRESNVTRGGVRLPPDFDPSTWEWLDQMLYNFLEWMHQVKHANAKELMRHRGTRKHMVAMGVSDDDLETIGYYCYVSIEFEIARNCQPFSIFYKHPKDIYTDNYVMDKKTRVHNNNNNLNKGKNTKRNSPAMESTPISSSPTTTSSLTTTTGKTSIMMGGRGGGGGGGHFTRKTSEDSESKTKRSVF